MIKQVTTLATVVYILVACPTPATAYLDPISGSVAFQVVMATALTGLAGIKIYWRRLKSLLRKSDAEPGRDEG